MLIFIMLLIIVLMVVIVAAVTHDLMDTFFTFILASLLGFVITAAVGAGINDGRDPEAGWSVVDERTYTLAEGSEIEMMGTDINIVAEIDGSLKPVTLEGIRKVDFPGESARNTAVVQEEFRDVGTDIFWWGEGQTRTVLSVR